ncbi:MAG: ester cyclase [Nocardioides sp.]
MNHDQQVRDLWRRVWSEGDVAFAHEFFASHYRENDRDRTPEGHAAGATAFRKYFPDFRAEVIGLKGFDDVVMSRVIFRGTYAGGWAGVHSPGAKIEVSGLDVFHFEGKLVHDHWHEADHEGMWEQLGVALPPG